jgi:ribosomal protein L7/L12
MTILMYAVIGLSIAAVVIAYNAMRIRRLRLRGLYPEPGQATMQHVKSLISTGNKALAIRVYREIHSVSLKQAKQAIENIVNAA